MQFSECFEWRVWKKYRQQGLPVCKEAAKKRTYLQGRIRDCKRDLQEKTYLQGLVSKERKWRHATTKQKLQLSIFIIFARLLKKKCLGKEWNDALEYYSRPHAVEHYLLQNLLVEKCGDLWLKVTFRTAHATNKDSAHSHQHTAVRLLQGK